MKLILSVFLSSLWFQIFAQTSLEPLTTRVNIQQDTAPHSKIIDGQWVGVGTSKTHAIQKDYQLTYKGKPSYRFELKAEDNTLEGYAVGSTKGRAELSYCYATTEDFQNHPGIRYEECVKTKTVYHYGKGSCPQGSSRQYRFAIYIPSSFNPQVNTIFAQWHGMPDRTLVQTPEGEIKKITPAEFCELYEHMIFKKDQGYEKTEVKNAKGKTTWKAGKPNGWKVEQGGFPPLAFGIHEGYFYIKANSDRKWMSDKTDRCNASPVKNETLKPVSSNYKSSVIAYKTPFEDFPTDRWVTFTVQVTWTTYGQETETIVKPGNLDVVMEYPGQRGKTIREHLVNRAPLNVGRNDDAGYYFKFGIYRVGNSTTPVCYHLAGYEEQEIK